MSNDNSAAEFILGFQNILAEQEESERKLAFNNEQRSALQKEIDSLTEKRDNIIQDCKNIKDKSKEELETQKANYGRVFAQEELRHNIKEKDLENRQSIIESTESRQRQTAQEQASNRAELDEKSYKLEKDLIDLKRLKTELQQLKEENEAILLKLTNIKKSNEVYKSSIASDLLDYKNIQESVKSETKTLRSEQLISKNERLEIKKMQEELAKQKQQLEDKEFNINKEQQELNKISLVIEKKFKDVQDKEKCLDAEKANFALKQARKAK